jgi:flagellar L-ring protein precursor FlgH
MLALRPNRIQRSVALAALAILGWLPSPAAAQWGRPSRIWETRDPRIAHPLNDVKARHVGDILTVLVNENTDVANSDRRALSKDANSKASANLSYDTGSSSGSGTSSFDTNAERSFSGDSDFRSEREFSDRFSVVVTDVLPNGNLVITGQRTVIVEGDARELSISGVVRDLDIRTDNSVLSNSIANLRMQFIGNGPETKFINQGWLGKKLNKLWPF